MGIFRRTVIAGALLALAFLPAVAAAIAPAKIHSGWFGWDPTHVTYKNAVYFKVKRIKVGAHVRVYVTSLRFRNACLTNNEPHPPKVRVSATGHLAKTWTSTAVDHPKISLSGTFVTASKAKGTLKVDDDGCKTTAHYEAKHGLKPTP